MRVYLPSHVWIIAWSFFGCKLTDSFHCWILRDVYLVMRERGYRAFEWIFIQTCVPLVVDVDPSSIITHWVIKTTWFARFRTRGCDFSLQGLLQPCTRQITNFWVYPVDCTAGRVQRIKERNCPRLIHYIMTSVLILGMGRLPIAKSTRMQTSGLSNLTRPWDHTLLKIWLMFIWHRVYS